MQNPSENNESPDLLRAFVERSRAALDKVEQGVDWVAEHPGPAINGVEIRRTTVEQGSPLFTVGEVTQQVGVVIPPHRHHESDVLLRVLQGAIQVDCEGYSRTVAAGEECLIPHSFNHTVYALRNERNVPAVYRSAHEEEWLSIDDNRLLVKWPEGSAGRPLTELEFVRERISAFLSLQKEYLTDFANYRAWFYLLHYDQDRSLQAKDKSGTAGDWSRHEVNRRHIREDYRKAEDFRLGEDLADLGWVKAKEYCSIFAAHKEKAAAFAVSPYHSYYDVAQQKWLIERPSGVQVQKFSETAFQKYMLLLTKTFLPDTRYIIYITPPQTPGLDYYLEDCHRKPYTSCIVGLTHGSPHFLQALSIYYLLCSAIIQQQRFAVRSDVTRVRYEEERRQQLFVEVLAPQLGRNK